METKGNTNNANKIIKRKVSSLFPFHVQVAPIGWAFGFNGRTLLIFNSKV